MSAWAARYVDITGSLHRGCCNRAVKVRNANRVSDATNSSAPPTVSGVPRVDHAAITPRIAL